MTRSIPEAAELATGGADNDLEWLITDTMSRFAASMGCCRLTKLGKAVTLAYRRNLDLSPLDQPGDFL